ncbi:MAG: amidase, partial [Rhodospirillaceae bacterium]|nr:amidase [Rhodospirillaceae bacterium]
KFDGTVVKRFAQAGAVLLGKLQQTEGAFADHHPDIEVPVNPWNSKHWSGASSSGSGVATAAGLCYGSLGTDTGGSIRFPSAANGNTGLKPTWGRVPRYGVFELAGSLDHVGPMTRSAQDAAAILSVIAGQDKNDPTAVPGPVPNYMADLDRGIRGLRIGIDSKFNSKGVDATMKQTVKDAAKVLKDLGAELVPVTFPSCDQIVDEWGTLCAIETAVAHAATYPKQKAKYGPALAGLIEAGRSVSAMEVQRANTNRQEFNGRVATLFENIDMLLIPAQYMASPTKKQMATLGEDANALAMMLRFTAPFDYTGSPTITLPSGFTKAGTPVAFQLVGRHLQEDVLLRAGHAYQQVTDWHKAHPKI